MKTYWKRLQLRCLGVALSAFVLAAPAPAHCGLLDILDTLGKWLSGDYGSSGGNSGSGGNTGSGGTGESGGTSGSETAPVVENLDPGESGSSPATENPPGEEEPSTPPVVENPPAQESPPQQEDQTPATNAPSRRPGSELAAMIARDAGGHADQYAAYSEKLAATLAALTQEQRARIFGGN